MTGRPRAGRMSLLAGMLLLPAVLSAQSRSPADAAPNTGAWSRVPAFATGCYSGTDQVGARLAAAIEAVNADLERHGEQRAAFNARVNAMDPMEQAQRMQAWMMRNPGQAAQAMQAVQATGEDATALRRESGGDVYKSKEFEQVVKNYQAALARVIDPTETAIRQHIDSRSKSDAHGFTFTFSTAADEARYLALIAQQNADYERLCAAWLLGNGTMPGWMRSYRTYLTDDLVPRLESADAAALMQYRMLLGAEAAGYQSRASLDALLDYLKKATVLNQQRREAKFAPASAFQKRVQ